MVNERNKIEMQMMKVIEEMFELDEAIKSGNVDKVIEEFADCEVALKRLETYLKAYYVFNDKELEYMKQYKKERTERRFREGYYGK